MAFSSETLFSVLNDLHSSSNAWAIKARVVRLYKQPSFANKNELGSVEMVIHDQEGVRIHVTMRPNIYEKFKKILFEGDVYMIKNFFVIENRNSWRTTNNVQKLAFFRTSVMAPYDAAFPRHMYNITPLDQLQHDQDIDVSLLRDVMGRVISYQKPFEGLKSKRMDFRIQDADNNQMSCTLWAEYIDDLLPILEENTDKPVVVCIQFARVLKFATEVKVSNTFHVTKVTVNEESDVFMEFMNRLTVNDNGVFNKMLTNTNYTIYEEFTKGKARVRTISYLKELMDDEHYWIDATVVDIENARDLWYSACKRCVRKLVTEPGTKSCVNCSEENPIDNPKFKLQVMVFDKTCNARLLLWNKACELLIGKSAAQLKGVYGECSDAIPKEIEDAVMDKRVLFEINLSTYKNVQGVACYTVSRCAYDDEIMGLYTKMYNGTQGSTSDDHGILTENSNSSPDVMDKNVKKNDKGKRKLFIDEDDEEDDAGDAVDEQEKCTEFHEVSAADLGNNAAGKTTNAAEKTSDAASAISPSDAVYTSKRRLIKKEK
ncbi:hypothetical protein CASFOL_041040 [Castilleja foliolosa]|uniref:Uncharacterized protein n=1 Tax=Castilleja foliolosa TaxID=1961234 RepID=A0ABD3BDZ7_9LAMI